MKGTGNPFPSCPDYLLYAKINPIPNRGPTIWCKWAAILSPRQSGARSPRTRGRKTKQRNRGASYGRAGGKLGILLAKWLRRNPTERRDGWRDKEEIRITGKGIDRKKKQKRREAEANNK